MMTAEERTWYLSRYNEEIKKKNDEEKRQQRKASSGIPKPSVRK